MSKRRAPHGEQGERHALFFLAAVCLSGLLAAPVRGQAPGPPLWTVDTVVSRILAEPRPIFVSLPPEYSAGVAAGDRFPVLIVLDAHAERRFPIAVALARMLAAPLAPEMPPTIVIGVENTDRFRDMTPPPLNAPALAENGAGGAAMFGRFLTEELLPMLRARYRADPLTVIAGHSLSGLFAAYLYGHSPAITAAIVLSPSLAWNNGRAYPQVLAGVSSRAAPGRLFVAASATEGRRIDSTTRQFAEDVRQRSNPSTTFEHLHYSRASHFNTWLQGLLDGMRFVFQPVSLAGHPLEHEDEGAPADTLIRSYERLRQRYSTGARELKLPEALPHRFGLSIARYMLDAKQYLVALHICRDLLVSRSDRWETHECVGDASRALGDRLAAARSYEAAVNLARAARAESITRLERKLSNLRQGAQ